MGELIARIVVRVIFSTPGLLWNVIVPGVAFLVLVGWIAQKLATSEYDVRDPHEVERQRRRETLVFLFAVAGLAVIVVRFVVFATQ